MLSFLFELTNWSFGSDFSYNSIDSEDFALRECSKGSQDSVERTPWKLEFGLGELELGFG